MSEPKLKEWVVELELDRTHDNFTVKTVRENSDALIPFEPYVYVQAHDELGAFGAARLVMERLGFNPNRA